jgi:hypothetical protein
MLPQPQDNVEAVKATRIIYTHPDTQYLAPDPSVGKKAEFFSIGVADARTMVRSMSPPRPGVAYSRSCVLVLTGVFKFLLLFLAKLMADAVLDAVQLPGRCHTRKNDDPATLVKAIHDLAEDRRGEWAAGEGPRRDDVQWKATTRTSLKTVTSHHEDLQARLTELQDLKGDKYENQVHAFCAILSDLPWSEASILA